jgi:hypothetical protein
VNLDQVFPAGVQVDATRSDPGTTFADAVWTVGDLAAGQTASLMTYFGVMASSPGGKELISTTATISRVNETLLFPDDDQVTVATDVASPTGVGVMGGAIGLDLQTGLFKQKVTVTNTSSVDLPAFRVVVNALPDGVSLHNAKGRMNGVPYVLVNQVLAAGERIELAMEFLQLDASGGFEPEFEVELLDTIEEGSAGDGVVVEDCRVLPTGDLLLEFTSVIGGVYRIQYRDEGEPWKDVLPEVVAGGTRQQWIDNGPPKTSSHPRECRSRLYRVRQVSPGS